MTPPADTVQEKKPLLVVKNLSVHYHSPTGPSVIAVNDLNFTIDAGETVALVGESGCGKTATAFAIMRLLQKPGVIAGGEILLDGVNLLLLHEKEMQSVRGGSISMIFQEPMTSLNPVLKIGFQITEGILRHRKITGNEAKREAIRLLSQVGIPDPSERFHSYPHQLSGGMKQRVMIAMALACSPRLLIADEPTTALDVTIQAGILELLDNLKRKFGMSLLLITHNLGIVAERADRTIIMYAGQTVEMAPTSSLMASPLHPYTKGLLASLPQNSPPGVPLPTISGLSLQNDGAGTGCVFASRCPLRQERCDHSAPPLVEVNPGHFVACWRAGTDE